MISMKWLNRKFLFFITGILALVFLTDCQEILLNDEEPDPILKNGIVIPAEGTLPSGALYEIELPPLWNALPLKVMVVYAHGYVDFDKPIALPDDAVGGVAIKDFLLNNGMGYASTSYRENGLAVVEGVADIAELHTVIGAYFLSHPGMAPPDAAILVGPSEGALITVLTMEQHPGLFQGAIATCGPIGDFYSQLQYYGDAHVLFKYFFGPSFQDINIGSPKHVSKNTMMAWNNGTLVTAIADVLADDYLNNGAGKIIQFMDCANIHVESMANPENVINDN